MKLGVVYDYERGIDANERSLCWAHVRAKFKCASDISKDKAVERYKNSLLGYDKRLEGIIELLA